MTYKDITPPAGGKITIARGKLNVPHNPIIPFIRGDGTGPDIWAASVRVFDAAVAEGLSRRTQNRLVRSPRRRKVLQDNSTTGCPTTPSPPSRNISSASKAR